MQSAGQRPIGAEVVLELAHMPEGVPHAHEAVVAAGEQQGSLDAQIGRADGLSVERLRMHVAQAAGQVGHQVEVGQRQAQQPAGRGTQQRHFVAGGHVHATEGFQRVLRVLQQKEAVPLALVTLGPRRRGVLVDG
eukprot:scaffold1850_cov194-Pinguiococcus_pyrenoidosus.AAC.41